MKNVTKGLVGEGRDFEEKDPVKHPVNTEKKEVII